MFRLLLILTAAAAFAGCSSTQPPNLTVLSARVKDRTDQGAVIEFVLEANNPNGVSLPLKTVTYTMALDGENVFTGTRSAEATIRRYGRQQISIPAVVALAPGQSVPPVSRYTLNGQMVYEVTGAITQTLFDIESLEPSVSFSGEGTIELPPARR